MYFKYVGFVSSYKVMQTFFLFGTKRGRTHVMSGCLDRKYCHNSRKELGFISQVR